MRFIALSALASLASANTNTNANTILGIVLKETCSSDACVTSSTLITSACGENGSTNYTCLCNAMPDRFYNSMLDCTHSCGVSSDFGDATNGADVKDYYCRLESNQAASAAAESAGGSSTASGSSSSSAGGAVIEGYANYYVSLAGLVAALLI